MVHVASYINPSDRRPLSLISLEFLAPHTGQSSQLVVDANGGGAQFLPTVPRSALNLPITPSREHWRESAYECSM